jgi:hydroxymethylpyrimidine pyrophosphatase-like HAD family hydrolase
MEYYRKSKIMPIRLKRLENIENRCTNGMFLVSEYNCDNSPLLSIIRELRKSSIWSEFGSFYLSSCGTLEFSNKGISKGSMVTHVIDELQIDPKRTLAIGDGLNDKEMLEIAAYSAAMGNASEKLKEIADLTIESNDSNGVANYLEKIF